MKRKNNLEIKKIMIPNTWKNPETHYIEVLKNPWYTLLVKLENLVSNETMKFYERKGIITMHLPVTSGSISSPMGKGSDSLPVKINLNNIDTYLADSMQFLLEYGCRLNKTGVYYVMPSFRGEQADERHLCQFYHSEVEIEGDLDDIISLAEEYIKYLSKRIIETYGDLLCETIGDISHIEKIANYNGKFPKITFDCAEKILIEKFPNSINNYIEYNNGWRNITKEGEKKLMEIFGGVLWLTNYDDLSVPFYQQLAEDNKTTKNADLFIGIGETIGCGERYETDLDVISSLKRHEVSIEEYNWYVTMKKMFPMKTSGFGMGIERYLMWVLKCNDIRNMQICLRFNGQKDIV